VIGGEARARGCCDSVGKKIWRVRRKRRRPYAQTASSSGVRDECVCLLALSRPACSVGWPKGSVDLVPNVFCSSGARSGFELLSNCDSSRDSI
jgi:hypothetical protein